MTIQSSRAQKASAPPGSVEFDADVLVIGGGPAGTSAAGTGVWYIDPDPSLREAAMADRSYLLFGH